MKKRIISITMAAVLLLGTGGSVMAASQAPVPTLINAVPELYAKETQTPIPGLYNTDAENPIPELYVADAYKYRGVVKEVNHADGDIASMLVEQKPGANGGNPNLLFHVNSDTKFNTTNANSLKQGQVVEVFYGGIVTASIPGQTTAIAVNILDQTQKQLTAAFTGKIKKVTNNNRGLSLLIDGRYLGKETNYKDEIVFHVTDDTIVTNGDLKDLVAGKSLIIAFSGALTKSIPAQGSALEITIVKETNSEVQTIVNGRFLNTTSKPYIKQGRVLVPMRDVFESLGASIEWDGAERSVTAKRDQIQIKLSIDQETAYLNGSPIQLDVAAEIEPDTEKAMVPLKFVAESLGQNVSWDDATRTVLIN